MRRICAGTALSLCLGLASTLAQAQTSVLKEQTASTTQPSASAPWRLSVSPYFWMAGIQGTSAQFGLPSADMKSDFGQIFKELDFAFMGILEARRGRYSILGDFSYTKISLKNATPAGFLSEKVGVRSETFSALLAGGYTILQSERVLLDVFAGPRLWRVKSTLSFQGGLLDQHSSRDSATWVDVVAGLRGNYFLTDKAYLMGWAAIGAGQANLDWDVTFGAGYQVQKNLSLTAGYRMQGVDYRRNGFVFDVIQKGPIMGLSYRF